MSTYTTSSKPKWLSYLYLKERKFLIVVIVINLSIAAVLGYYTPHLIADFYQSLKSDGAFAKQFSLLVTLYITEYCNRAMYLLASNRYVQHLLNTVREQSYSRWLKSSLRRSKAQEDYPMGEVLARLMSDTESVREVVGSGSFAIFIDILFIFFCLISFLELNSQTGIYLFAAEVAACWLLILGSKKMAVIFMEVRRLTGYLSRVVTDLTNGLKELFFNRHDHYALNRGEKVFEEFLDKQLHANIWDASYYSAAESMYPILIAVVMLVIPYTNVVEVAVLAALFDLIQKSITPIKDVAGKISIIQRAKTGIERLHQFNESFPHQDIIAPSASVELKSLNVKINSFSYHHQQAQKAFELKDIELDLKLGQIIGIVGESGCGKSTLLKLLSAQYGAFEGSADLNGHTQFDLSKDSELLKLTPYMSLISQDSHVFSESLSFNIGLGKTEGLDEFWPYACKQIPYLTRWGVELESEIEPNKISMGQKQLISGLRALFLNKKVIMLDEISSGLDPELEKAYRDLLHLLRERSMTIIVTHRLETILQADQVILMDAGRVMAKGKHQEMTKIPAYQNFINHLHS